MRTDAKLEREVAAIRDLPREELVARWVKTYGCAPPKGIKRGLLERSAAWHLQAKRLGGLSASSRRLIRDHARRMERQRQEEKARSERAHEVLGAQKAEAEFHMNAADTEAALPGSSERARYAVTSFRSDAANPGDSPSAVEAEAAFSTTASVFTSPSSRSRRAKKASPAFRPPPAPGTRLMREWNGRMHVVDITDQGVLFDGKLYRSLTAVAKRITGTHWSGPRFFGL